MTREDVIRMAREADLHCHMKLTDHALGIEDLERFAELVAALIAERTHTNNKAKWYQEGVESEREACIRLCESRNMGDGSREDQEARRIASEIRARGQS
jgi:biotin carboxylase